MSVAAGLAVMQATFEAEITAVAGPRGKHDPQRAAVRHGAGRGSVTLGGRRVPVSRPRARTVDGHEVPLASYAQFAADDLLSAVVMERMLAGLATRRHARAAEPVGGQVAAEAMSTSRSAVSRRFVRQTETALAELLARPLGALNIKVLMLDGEHLAERCCVVARAITADSTKVPVGLWDGDTENKTVVKALLADLVGRGLDATDGLLVVSTAPRRWPPGSARCSAPTPRCSAAPSTRDEMWPTTCPTRRRRGPTPSWSRRSPIPTPTRASATPSTSPACSIRPTPAPPRRCAKACPRCSPWPGSASTAGSPAP